MSLKVETGGRRARSRSPGRRDEHRDRSRSRGPEPDPLIMDAVRMPSPPVGYSYDDHHRDYAPQLPRRPAHDYDDRRSSYGAHSPPEDYNRPSRERVSDDGECSQHSRRNDRKSKGDRDWDEQNRLSSALSGAAAYLPAKYAQKLDAKLNESDSDKEMKKQLKQERLEDDLAYGKSKYSSAEFSSSTYAYAQPAPYGYEKLEEKPSYFVRNAEYGGGQLSPDADIYSRRAPNPGPAYTSSAAMNYHPEVYGQDPRSSSVNVLTVEPSSSKRRARSRSHSPLPPTQRISSLTVNTSFPTGSTLSLANAPGSPLLESYHGTYQSMSPMPSPLLLASNGPGAFPVEPLSPGISDDERGEKKRRRARFVDPKDDASRLAQALKSDRKHPETGPLIEVLPGMTHEQIMDLRVEYKRIVKTGSERKGVNIAKHIRARLKDEDPLLMKACYATALGKWESEAYWANFWYQGDKTRRELLIESIMGRTNDEIRAIKDGFIDKKYRDSLTQCMKTELKEDKFKKAVLMVLEERRMDEYDEYGRPIPIDERLLEDDIHNLHKAVMSEKGGETAMIQTVVMRSDTHLRAVLKLYERTYRSNFARDALKKSGNLIGELLAHILNGVINKPVRDALLLHHALTASRKDGLRRELLISRLVRCHWDRHHMAAIKYAYRGRYGTDLSHDIKEITSGEWGQFCSELCVTRTPDEVKRFSI